MLTKDTLNQLKDIKKEIRNSKDLHKAKIRGTRWKYGFARMKNGEDILVPAEEMLKVFPDDEVEINIISGERKRPYAKIDKLFKSSLKQIVGRVIERKQHMFITPDVHGLSQNLYIPPPFRKKAKQGDLVVAQITSHPFKEGKAQAKITEIITGEKLPLKLNYILKKYQLNEANFEEDALIKETQQRYENGLTQSFREDLTALNFITIDNTNSQDLDDAVYAEKTNNGWKLYIAIADPSELVEPLSHIDKYAYNMGGSVYLPKHNIPMLPKFISQKFASIIPNENRLALTCEIDINANGDITDTRLYEAIVCSKAQLNYNDVSKLLNQQETLCEQTQANKALLEQLNELAKLLEQQQQAASCQINKNLRYAYQLNSDYAIESISQLEQNDAQKLIETFMVTCNTTVANWLLANEIKAPFLHHPGLRDSQLTFTQQLLKTHAPELSELAFDTQAGFKQLIDGAKQISDSHDNEKSSKLIDILYNLLDKSEFSLKQSKHMSLGIPAYTHFTSPIRRFQDLTIHRFIKAQLRNTQAPRFSEKNLEHLNDRIQRNRYANQQLENWLYADWLNAQDKHNTFEATIQQLQGNHISAQLTNCGINGQLDLNDVKDYKFNGTLKSFSKEDSHLTLGQTIPVSIKHIDMNTHQVIFNWNRKQ